ncbi:MAG: hypothetical protein KTR25_00990 [Myxococcales bacterium]|nr:hypothetical protein [Myxococcales bacterium]
MGNLRAWPGVLALFLIARVGTAQTPAPKESQADISSEEAGKAEKSVAARTLLVVDDRNGSVVTRQLSLSALMLYAGMSNPEDELGLFAESNESLRIAPKPLARKSTFSGLRTSFRKLPELEPVSFEQLSDYISKIFAEPKPSTADAVLIVAHELRDGVESPSISPEFGAKLKKMGILAYVVALGATTDMSAYEDVVEATGGKAYQVKKGSDLKSAFSDIFASLHNRERLIIVEDKVVLDGSISKATVVLPKKTPKTRNRVITPGERILGAKTKYPGVAWQSFKDYDLVRIENPEAGVWRLDQPEGADQAVGLVNSSDFSIQVRIEPESPMIGGRTRIRAVLLDKDTPVDSYTKLKHMVMEAVIEAPSGHLSPVRLTRDEGGFFSGEIVNEIQGYHSVRLSVFSPEIRRERELAYLVNPECFSGKFEEEQRRIVVYLSQTCPRFVELYALVRVFARDKLLAQHSFKRNGRTMVVGLPKPELGVVHELRVDIQGKTIDGFVVRSDGGGPYNDAARDPVLMDYVWSLGTRWFVLNIPLLVGFLGFVAVRQARRLSGPNLGDSDWEDEVDES